MRTQGEDVCPQAQEAPPCQHPDLGLLASSVCCLGYQPVLLCFGGPGDTNTGQECNVGSPTHNGRLLQSQLELEGGISCSAIALVRQRALEL